MRCSCMKQIQLKGHIITMSPKKTLSIINLYYQFTPESRFTVTNNTMTHQERKCLISIIKISKAT